MPGIIVGIDGSGHSHRALIRAMKEAVAHHAPLTVLTVHQAVMGFGGGPVNNPGDQVQADRAREAAQAETDKALAEIGEPRRRRSPSRRFTASRPKYSSTRAGTPT